MNKNNDLKKIIVTIGVIGSGKTYYQNYIEGTYKVYSFANKLRELAYRLLSYDDIQIEEMNKVKRYYEYFKNYCNVMIKFLDPKNKDILCKSISFRNFLQWLGSEVCKPVFGEDIWANLLINSIKNDLKNGSLNDIDTILIDDCRFIEELLKINELIDDFYIHYVFCNYTESEKYKPDNEHKSEKLAQHFLKNNFKHHEEVGWYITNHIDKNFKLD